MGMCYSKNKIKHPKQFRPVGRMGKSSILNGKPKGDGPRAKYHSRWRDNIKIH